MKKNIKNNFIYITGELEELVYKKALNYISEYQKNLFLMKYNPMISFKKLFQEIIDIGDTLYTKHEIENGENFDYRQYPHLSTDGDAESYIVAATNELLVKYCHLDYFAGVIKSGKDAIILSVYNETLIKVKKRIESLEANKEVWNEHDCRICQTNIERYYTLVWIKKFNLDGKTLSNIEECQKVVK